MDAPAPQTTARRAAFWRGFAATLPLQVATIPFGLFFGIVAVETGLDLAQIVGFTVIVLAGASSLVAMELIQEQAPALIVILAGAMVNLRMAMYSAALVPHWEGVGSGPRWAAGYFLNDQTYTIALKAYEDGRLPSRPEKLAYFFGSGCCCIPGWCLSVFAGVALGAQVPPEWGLEMAAPALFLALSAPLIRTPAHMIACTAAVLAALPATALPQGIGVIAASVVGILAGMLAKRVLG
ncbi:MAG: AzlC family ABC transporter permease [Pseudomonadota bacterium]